MVRGFPGSLPISQDRRLPGKRAQSQAPSLRGRYPLHRYYGPVRLPTGPPPYAAFAPQGATGRASHVAQRTFRTCRCHYPGGRAGRFGCLDRPATAFAPSLEARRRVFTFEACSAFTRVTAHAVAPPAFPEFARSFDPMGYPIQPSRLLPRRTDNSSGGSLIRWPSEPSRDAQRTHAPRIPRTVTRSVIRS